MIKALKRLIEGPDYLTDDIEPKTPIVESDKGVKIKALTKIIPASEVKQKLQNFASMLIPLVPSWLLEFEDDSKHYLVPKSQLDVLVSDEDIDDWNYLLERFNSIMGNLTKLLNNIRKIDYHKIVHDKLLEREIRNRKIKLTEKLLEKTNEKKEESSARSSVTDDMKLDALMLAGMSTVMGSPVGPASADKVAIAKKLIQKYGLKDYQAAAIVGTWMREGLGKGRPDDIEDAYAAQYGDFGPPPIGSTRVGYGWAQWTNMVPGGRLDTVANGIGVTDRNWTDRDNYAAFDWELRNKYPALMGALKKTQTIDEAVQLFVHVYEAGGDIQSFVNMHGQNFMPDRVNAAKSVFTGLTQPSNQASGAIILPPSLMQNMIYYNTGDKTDDLANFIVDRPTIIDTSDVGEPLIVIPTERPIGQEILNILFKDSFIKIERIFERNEKEQLAKAQTSIENNTTSIKRSPIPKSSSPTSNYLKEQKEVMMLDSMIELSNDFIEQIKKPFSDESSSTNDFTLKMASPSVKMSESAITNIDTVSQKTQNVFGRKVILMTQDIYTTEG